MLPLALLKLTEADIEILIQLQEARRGLADSEIAALIQRDDRYLRGRCIALCNRRYLRESNKEYRKDGVKPVRIWHITPTGVDALKQLKR